MSGDVFSLVIFISFAGILVRVLYTTLMELGLQGASIVSGSVFVGFVVGVLRVVLRW